MVMPVELPAVTLVFIPDGLVVNVNVGTTTVTLMV
jgi:hypothetical protein